MFVNTREFRRSALYYLKHGTYTSAPEGTRDYIEYWARELHRCINGYSVAGTRITGKHYFYLNYCKIERIPEHILRDKTYVGEVKKEFTFPGFWQIDHEWFNAKERAKKLPLGQGNHLVCLKTRGCGFSYKEASDGVHNYIFVPKSKSFYVASDKEYLVGDAILDKVNSMLSHINVGTYFKKEEQKKFAIMHRRASYIDDDNKNVEKGFLSEIQGVVVPPHNPDKIRGKRGLKITFEEAGSFGNIKAAWMIARESIEQGGYLAGQMSLFGTGGEEGEDIEGLEDIFKDPLSYNCLPFDNKWSEVDLGLQDGNAFHIPTQFNSELINELPNEDDSVCGFFVPNVVANDKFMDEDGNLDLAESFKFELNNRLILSKAKDIKTRDRKLAERPFTPDEALYRLHQNDLPGYEAKEQLKRVEGSKHIQGMLKHGVLVTEPEKGVVFKPANVSPITKYPHSNTDALEGCISIVETPIRINGANNKKVVPPDTYMIMVDPYKKDDAEDKTSLGAAYVFKLENSHTGHVGDIPVAWYVGRPNKLKEFHRNLFKLAEYYNAKIQSENDGGGEAIIQYARHNKLLDRLEYEPDMLHNKEMASSSKNRTYLMNMPPKRKELGILYLSDWLQEKVGVDDFGNDVLRIHKIYDVGLLNEIVKYRKDRNADRISAMIIAVFMLKETHEIRIKQMRKKKSSFFSRSLFTDGQVNNFKVEDGVIWYQ